MGAQAAVTHPVAQRVPQGLDPAQHRPGVRMMSPGGIGVAKEKDQHGQSGEYGPTK